MSINIQAKTNYSFLFSGLSSSASNAVSGNWLADYASIKNGSYGKLMKAYYAKDSGDSKTAASTIAKKDTATDTAKKALAKEVIAMTEDFADGYYFSFPFNRVTMLEKILD